MTELYKKNGAVFIPAGITVEEVENLKDGNKVMADNYSKMEEKEVEDKVFYIVGKITGDKNYKTKFYNAYKFLTEKTGHDKVISPTCTPDNLPYECYAPISIGFVQACDCLFVLRDWKESKGARAEVACKKLERDFIGIEINKDYFEIAKNRIKMLDI